MLSGFEQNPRWVPLKSSDKLSLISLKEEVYNRPFSNKPFQ